MVQYHETTCQLACEELRQKTPYHWECNPYRGCEHGCCYCNALGSHRYLDEKADFYHDIYVNTNIIERLEQQLRQPSWNHEVINIGGITDSYQPAEEKYQLMPEILRLLIRYQTPVTITTKSTLILRDYDLIEELSRSSYVNIAVSVTTCDESMRRKLEPDGAPTAERFSVLRALQKTNACTGLHMIPVIPYLTDGQDNIRSLLQGAKECQTDYVLPGMLYLRGETRSSFLAFIEREYPEIYTPMLEMYRTGGAERHYKNNFYKEFHKLRKQYGLSANYRKPMRDKLARMSDPQLSLFQ